MKYWSEFGSDVYIDKIGNIIAHIKGESNNKIMIASHLDEIGGTIRIIYDGRLKFSKRGNYEDRWVTGKKVKVRTSSNEWINGIIEGRSIHGVSEEYRSKAPKVLEESHIYLGAESKDEIINWGVHIGAPFVFDEPFSQLGKNEKIVSGKSFDDLVGVVAATVLLKEISQNSHLKNDIYIVGTVREELGAEGGLFAAKEISPDYFISIDTAYSPDKSSPMEIDNNVEFNKGPVIVWQDSSGKGIYNAKMCDEIKKIAQSANMPIQDSVFEYYSSDAQQVQKNYGIPSICLGIPTKYNHQPPEVVNLKNILEASSLIKLFIEQFLKE
jgi:endoglucanase